MGCASTDSEHQFDPEEIFRTQRQWDETLHNAEEKRRRRDHERRRQRESILQTIMHFDAVHGERVQAIRKSLSTDKTAENEQASASVPNYAVLARLKPSRSAVLRTMNGELTTIQKEVKRSRLIHSSSFMDADELSDLEISSNTLNAGQLKPSPFSENDNFSLQGTDAAAPSASIATLRIPGELAV